MQKINLNTNEIEFEDSIDCIRLAVDSFSLEKLSEVQKKKLLENLLDPILVIQSSEYLREIKLTPEEKFKALKSWVAGIAEFGIDAFKIQTEVANLAYFAYPMILQLLKFMPKVNSDFIHQYLSKIERECRFEGANHKSSMIANLLPIFLALKGPLEEGEREPDLLRFKKLTPEDQGILSAIMAIKPPQDLFNKNPSLFIFLKDYPLYRKRYSEEEVF